MQERLASLRVTTHPGAHPRPVDEGIPFLGFVVFPQRRRLKRRKGLYFRAKLRRLLTAARAGELPVTHVTASVQGWVNHVRYGNTVGLRKAMLQSPPLVSAPTRRQRMSLTPETWKTAFTKRLPQWRQRMQQAGITSVYAFVSTMALWPVAAAFHGGDVGAMVALSGVLAGVGGNLIANRLQRWQDETEAARQLTAEVAAEPALLAELDIVLETLDAVAQARDALPAAERQWFTETLRAELARLGNTARYTAQLTGSGAIAQGPGAVAAGQGGIAIGGSVHDNVSLGSGAEKKSSLARGKSGGTGP